MYGKSDRVVAFQIGKLELRRKNAGMGHKLLTIILRYALILVSTSDHGSLLRRLGRLLISLRPAVPAFYDVKITLILNGVRKQEQPPSHPPPHLLDRLALGRGGGVRLLVPWSPLLVS